MNRKAQEKLRSQVTVVSITIMTMALLSVSFWKTEGTVVFLVVAGFYITWLLACRKIFGHRKLRIPAPPIPKSLLRIGNQKDDFNVYLLKMSQHGNKWKFIESSNAGVWTIELQFKEGKLWMYHFNFEHAETPFLDISQSDGPSSGLL